MNSEEHEGVPPDCISEHNDDPPDCIQKADKDPEAMSEHLQSTHKNEPDFTVFAHAERILLMLTLSLIGFWSTISSPIYFPAIPTVSKAFHVLPSVSNISVVAYLVFQGIAPAFTTSLAGHIGIRPVLCASVTCYVGVCIAISQTNVFWLLAVLRCFQAALIAPVIAIGSGVLGDVCTRANRGSFIGTVSGCQLIGNSFGALIGAALISGFNTWRAIFVFLAIGGGVTMIYAFIFLPETSRLIVGNGSVVPKYIINRAPLSFIPFFGRRFTNEYSTLTERRKFRLFKSFEIMGHIDTILVLAPAGMVFASWTVMLTTMSSLLEEAPYNYSVMHVGIVYIPQGIATLVTSLSVGATLNWYYRRRLNQCLERSHLQELEGGDFNIIQVRLDICVIPIFVNAAGLLIFGWCMHFHKHISLIFISTTMVSFSLALMISCVTTVLVDMFPDSAHSLALSLNVMRCLLSALFVGVLDKMEATMTVGGTFTFLAGLCLLSAIGMYYRFYVFIPKHDDLSEKYSIAASDLE